MAIVEVHWICNCMNPGSIPGYIKPPLWMWASLIGDRYHKIVIISIKGQEEMKQFHFFYPQVPKTVKVMGPGKILNTT